MQCACNGRGVMAYYMILESGEGCGGRQIKSDIKG